MEVTSVSNVPHPQRELGAKSSSPNHINASSGDTVMLVSDNANAASPLNPLVNSGNASSIMVGAGNERKDGNSLETSNTLKRKREDAESVDKTDVENEMEKSKAMRLTSHLVLCLQYAKLKVEHGWHKESFAEVERLYFGDREIEGARNQSSDRRGTTSGDTMEQRKSSATSGTNTTASVSHPNPVDMDSDPGTQFSSADFSFANRRSTTPKVQTISASSGHRKSRSKNSKQSQPRPISLPPHLKTPSQPQSQSQLSGSLTANQIPDTSSNAISPGPPTSSLSSHSNAHASTIPSYPASVSTPVPPVPPSPPPPPVPVYASPFDAVAATYPDAFSPLGTSAVSSSSQTASSTFSSLPTHPITRSINLSNGLNAFTGNLNTLSAFNQYHQHNQQYQFGFNASNPSSSLSSLSLLPTLTYDSFWNSHSHTTSSLPTSSSNLFSRSSLPSSASSSLPSLPSSASTISDISPLPGSGNSVRPVPFRTSLSGAGSSISETGAAPANTKGGATGLTARTIVDIRSSLSPTSGSSSASGSVASSKGIASGADARPVESRANSGVRVVRRAFDTPAAVNSMGPLTAGLTRNLTGGLNHPTLPPSGYPVNFSIPISVSVSTVVANGGSVGTRS
ncbi:hypothetical protein BDP27DRAFT_1323312 [Rhodocollybia butyracea]|uniref:Uncharacterized protein n=1 Tax=Rhodocollybia butyracea TaxID=206335 RepID=A0A9P5UA65_9AGAR|nr:hypothetical protein BDP27DRAFT_1323312 [Rhodocollybia butyracea]